MVDLVITIEDPYASDVRVLIAAHLEFARVFTPSDHVHALPADGLVDPTVTLFGARSGGTLVGIGALKELDPGHGEIKSMHTAQSVRGQGVGRAMVEHLLATASDRGYRRVSLETGTMDAFAPARALYDGHRVPNM